MQIGPVAISRGKVQVGIVTLATAVFGVGMYLSRLAYADYQNLKGSVSATSELMEKRWNARNAQMIGVEAKLDVAVKKIDDMDAKLDVNNNASILRADRIMELIIERWR